MSELTFTGIYFSRYTSKRIKYNLFSDTKLEVERYFRMVIKVEIRKKG